MKERFYKVLEYMVKMSEEVLAIFIPGMMPADRDAKNGDIDLLFNSKDMIVKNIINDDQFMFFKENMDKYKYPINPKKEELHIEHIIDYLKRFFKMYTGPINFEKFKPDTAYILYRLLAREGNIIIINSQYNILIYLPSVSKVTKKQYESLVRLSTIINPNIGIEAEVVTDIEAVEGLYYDTFNEIVEYINGRVMK